jgi:hypothetical protein
MFLESSLQRTDSILTTVMRRDSVTLQKLLLQSPLTLQADIALIVMPRFLAALEQPD